MKIVKLWLPGRFEDAFVYRSWLVLLTEEKSIRFVSLDVLLQDLKNRVEFQPWPELLFLRNDWLSSAQFSAITRSKSVRRVLNKALTDFARKPIVLKLGTGTGTEFDPKIPCRVFYDMMIYYGRLYTGTDAGLFHTDISWQQSPEVQSNRAERRLDAKCVNTSAAYGTINASCGYEGLFSSFGEFGTTSTNGDHNFDQVAPISLRTMWFGSDVVNYESRTKFALFESDTAASSQQANQLERERKIVTSFRPMGSLDYLLDVLGEHEKVQREEIRFVFNSSSVFFVHTRTGFFYSLGVNQPDDGPLQFKWSRCYKGESGRIVSAHILGRGTLIETDRKVLLFQNNEWVRVLQGEVMSIRTFARSRRFRHMACLTRSDGLLLTGVFDDTVLHQAAI